MLIFKIISLTIKHLAISMCDNFFTYLLNCTVSSMLHFLSYSLNGLMETDEDILNL